MASVDQAELVRIQRILEETLDGHLASDDATREGALVQALRAELAGVPEQERGRVVDALLDLYPPPPVSSVSGREEAAELLRLRDEVEQLRRRPEVAPAGPNVAGDAMAAEVVRALLGAKADVEPVLASGGGERVAAVVRSLVEFASHLGRTYLAATSDTDHTMAGRVQHTIASALLGRSSPQEFEAMLRTVEGQVASQLLAFRDASVMGGLAVLKQVSPAVVESEVSKQSGLLSRPFWYKECWDLLQARHEQLKTDEGEMYERYFDGPLRAALYERAREARGARQR